MEIRTYHISVETKTRIDLFNKFFKKIPKTRETITECLVKKEKVAFNANIYLKNSIYSSISRIFEMSSTIFKSNFSFFLILTLYWLWNRKATTILLLLSELNFFFLNILLREQNQDSPISTLVENVFKKIRIKEGKVGVHASVTVFLLLSECCTNGFDELHV